MHAIGLLAPRGTRSIIAPNVCTLRPRRRIVFGEDQISWVCVRRWPCRGVVNRSQRRLRRVEVSSERSGHRVAHRSGPASHRNHHCRDYAALRPVAPCASALVRAVGARRGSQRQSGGDRVPFCLVTMSRVVRLARRARMPSPTPDPGNVAAEPTTKIDGCLEQRQLRGSRPELKLVAVTAAPMAIGAAQRHVHRERAAMARRGGV